MTDLPKVWALVKTACVGRGTCYQIPPRISRGLHRYYEFDEHNELELACDALEESTRDRAASREFWIALRDAATKIQPGENAVRYERHAGERISGT
jgi:hypothetical protein